MSSVRKRLARAALVAAALLLVVAAPGCGCHNCEDTYWGNVFVDNLTDLGPNPESVLTFFLAPVGGTWTSNLLPAPLPPARTQFVGTFSEDYYDAEADTELGDLVTWYDIFVGAADDVFFEVYSSEVF